MSGSAIHVIEVDPVASLIGFTMWLSLLAGAIFSFCLLSGHAFPGASIWIVLIPAAMLLSAFSSAVHQLSRHRV